MKRALAPLAALSVVATASVAFASPSFYQARGVAQNISNQTRAFLNVARFKTPYANEQSAALSAVQRLHLSANDFLVLSSSSAPWVLSNAFAQVADAFNDAQAQSGWLAPFGSWHAIAMSASGLGSALASLRYAAAPSYVPAVYLPTPVNSYRPVVRRWLRRFRRPARRSFFRPVVRVKTPSRARFSPRRTVVVRRNRNTRVSVSKPALRPSRGRAHQGNGRRGWR